MQDPVADLLSFIDRSPTPYHAVDSAVRLLEDAGYTRLEESEAWSVLPGDRRYVVRGGSLAAFEAGGRPPADAGFRIVGAHTDSPNLRVKPIADVRAHGYAQLAVEPYGGVLLHTWLDRDLSLAGRVVVRDGAGMRTELVDLGRPILRIPSLAIHLNQELKTEGLKLNAQQNLVPVLGMSEKTTLATVLREALSAKRSRKASKPAEVLAYDLMVYDSQPAARGGADGELVLAPRLDNLASCHAALRALLAPRRAGAAGRKAATRAIVFYDHEEVGSRSQAGAAGSFLADVLQRVAGSFEATGEKAGRLPQAFERAAARSWLVSADMAHAVHPNYADRHEPGHRPVVGRGPVLKRNSNQSYATDAQSAGLFTALCREVGITPQHFVARSDLGCGSTIGPISAARAGIRTVDLGKPMLSMHSCREMAGAADVAPMIALLAAFFESEIQPA
jgi:aspartyl aminopeptidase